MQGLAVGTHREGSKTLPGGWYLCQRPAGPLAPSPQALSPQLRRSPEVKDKQETLLIPKQGVRAAEHVRGSPSQASRWPVSTRWTLVSQAEPESGDTVTPGGEGTPRPFPLGRGCRSSPPHTASSPRPGAHAAWRSRAVSRVTCVTWGGGANPGTRLRQHP